MNLNLLCASSKSLRKRNYSTSPRLCFNKTQKNQKEFSLMEKRKTIFESFIERRKNDILRTTNKLKGNLNI